MLNIPNVRTESALRLRVSLEDNGVEVSWPSLSEVMAMIYSDSQKLVAGRATVAVDEDDPTILIVDYAGHQPQYAGIAKLIVRCKYQGREKTFDKPVVNFVETTAEADGVEVLEDPVVAVSIKVKEVSTSMLDDAIAAAFSAAKEALVSADLADEAAKLAMESSEKADGMAAKAELKIQQAQKAIEDAGAAERAAKQAAQAAQDKAVLADDMARKADTAAGGADDAARNANEKAGEAEAKARLANEKALLADEKARQAEQATRDTNAAKTEAEKSTTKANTAAQKANEAAQRQPKIVDGYWYVWNVETGQYVNTGVKALGEGGGASVEVIDRLDSPSATAALSAKQGMLLKSLVDGKTSFSGNYNDLTNKPTIPAAVTEATVSGWGFTKNNGTYSKPSGGIPKTDLAESVQTSLGKADTAVQPSAISDMETKTHASQTYQPKGSYATSAQLQTVSEKVDLMYEDYTTALNLV